ncbi:hypothetical protein A2678_00150 [Candidatus Kaiserbacteria bacterium RIFCSPHIGHO2_01_FULL_53_31]|uniref:Uncharacterized protein n=1 Tax=Candidatus Kaiserbacteria bacterium RIFCSPHIGHO2_01_FULL_53_31 TaxID=1798481 RepID=A0A1F6CIZ6_9BACT|nr:MAG: hypothetical protein A2678_00150 [Candidatus Kaiserbacteria bacterium RIFCSPHIGHO2_01_FULL_53_31]
MPPLGDTVERNFVNPAAATVRWDTNPVYYEHLYHGPPAQFEPLRTLYRQKYGLRDGDIYSAEDYRNHKQLWAKLKRRFQMKKDEKPRTYKDLGWVCELPKTDGKVSLTSWYKRE